MDRYYDDPRISQSHLKRYLNPNPRSLFRSREEDDYYYRKEKIYFSKGKLLDILLEGKDVNEFFFIESSDYKHPSAVVESIAQEVYERDCLSVYNLVIQIKDKHNYQARWKEETILKWIDETLYPIIVRKRQIGNKVILSQEDYDKTATIATSILNGEFTKPILDEYPGSYQAELYTDTLKGLLDYLQIDHEKKLMRIIDLKTTSDYLEA